jgi:hypothetical protein
VNRSATYILAAVTTILLCSNHVAWGFEFDPDPTTPYLMPPHFGSPTFPNDPVAHYGHTTALTISFLTTYDAVAGLLPTWVSHGKRYGYRPLPVAGALAGLEVTFSMNRDVDFLGGVSSTGRKNGYNIVQIGVSAEFIGEREWKYNGQSYCGARGGYALVLWENDTDPIMLGREILGVPKLFAEIDGDVDTFYEDVDASGYGVLSAYDKTGEAFITADVTLSRSTTAGPLLRNGGSGEMDEGDSVEWATCGKYEVPFYTMGWKYIPRADFGQADLSYATALPSSSCPDPENTETCCPPDAFATPLTGFGTVRFPKIPTVEEFPSSYQIVEKLKDLFENHAYGFPGNATVSKGCSNLLIREQHAMDGPVMPRWFCGLGSELILFIPPLMWLYRRRGRPLQMLRGPQGPGNR